MGPLETALRAAAALWMIACTLAAAWRIGFAVVGTRGLALRWTAVWLSGMWLATAGFHLLLPWGGFKLPVALAACTLLGLGAGFLPPGKAALAAAAAVDARALRRLRQAYRASPYRAYVFLFIVLGAPLVVRTLVIPPLAWDSLTYHNVRAALWVQSGQYTFDRAPGPWTGFRHVFAGSEVLTAWAMLPFHGDLFAGLVSALQWIGVGLGGYAYARELGLREPYASTAAGAGMFIPTLELLVGSGYTEPALLAALLGSFALTLRFLYRPDGRVACLALAGCGLTAGIKLTGAPPALLAVGLVVLFGSVGSVGVIRIRAWRPGVPGALGARRRLGWIALGCLCALVPVVPWMVRCYRETGYLVTLPVQVLGMKLGASDPSAAWFLHRPELTSYQWETEKAALAAVFAPPGATTEALGLFSLLPLLLFPLGLVTLARRRPAAAVLVLGAIVTVIRFYWSREVAVLRLLWSADISRFLLGGLLLAIPVSLLGCARWPRAGRVYRGFLLFYGAYYAWFFAHFTWSTVELGDATLIFLVLLAGALVAGRLARLQTAGPALALGFVTAFWIAGSVLLSARREETRYATASASTQLHWEPKYWVEAAWLLDHPRAPSKIAVTSGPWQDGDHWFTYYFLGRQLQNRLTYVPVTGDGRIVPFGPNDDLEQAARRRRWLERLDEARVTAVMSFTPLSIEQRWMDEMPRRFEKLRGGPDWGLYRVR
jgi:hypothetical protein